MKQQNTTLREKIDSLSHLENVQVTSAMTSIQFEEQLESIENEKRQFQTDYELLTKTNSELYEKINILTKDKQELALKLEHYIQENIDLVDKLEKLSTEKVSSAESIEIVEALTQQEKLELEAYQKNLDLVSGNLKLSEENLPRIDLNESVNELTEETSELLQKIELFTVERREVMDKMEMLKRENNELNMKLQQISNNKDVLEETYEQLQTEKEKLLVQLDEVRQENEDLKKSNGDICQNCHVWEEKSRVIQEKLDKNKTEIDTYNQELSELRSRLEEKAQEVEVLSNYIKELQEKLEEKENQNLQINNNLIDLNRVITDLETDSTDLTNKIKLLEIERGELNVTIVKLQEELQQIKDDSQRELDNKNNEIEKLVKERNNTESIIQDLHHQIQEKDEKIQKVCQEMKEKYEVLQTQLNQNSGSFEEAKTPLEKKIQDLTDKNKEQLDKLKKFAANLKKKNQSYQELQEQTKEKETKWEKELHEKELKIQENQEEITDLIKQTQNLDAEVLNLRQLLNEKTKECAKLNEDFQFFTEEKTEEIKSLNDKNTELQNLIIELKTKERTNEISLEQELWQTRSNIIPPETSEEVRFKTKIQELEMIIETQEHDLLTYKTRVGKLEEGISLVEERRLSLERKANELGAQLEEKVLTCDEISLSEDLLEKRLAALSAHDETIEKKLEETVAENQECTRQNQELIKENEGLRKKLDQIIEKHKNFDDLQRLVEELENQNDELKKQIDGLENDLKYVQKENERILEETKNDLEKISCDWQGQFEELLKEKGELMVRCERFQEELAEIAEKEMIYDNEITEYKQKLDWSQTEIRNYEKQMDELTKHNQEIENLNRLIQEKNQELGNYTKNIPEENPQRLSSFFDQQPTSPDLQVDNTGLVDVFSSVNDSISLEKVCNVADNRSVDGVNVTDDSLRLENKRLEELLQKTTLDLEAARQEIEQSKIASLDLKNIAETTVDAILTEAETRLSPQREAPPVPPQIWGGEPGPFDFYQEIQSSVQQTIDDNRQETKAVTMETPQQTTVSQPVVPPQIWGDFCQEIQSDPVETSTVAMVAQQTIDDINRNESVIESVAIETNQQTNEDLLNKIKTLEFMLFSVEKEKEDAIFQCNQLTSELTRLVYDRENLKNQSQSLESQVLQDEQVKTCADLHEIEFTPTKDPVVHSLEAGAVVEEPVETSNAYLCYPEDKKEVKDVSSYFTDNQAIECQIVPDQELVSSSQTKKQLQQIEFEPVNPPRTTNEPIQEDPVKVKEAYLCFSDNQAGLGDDDGWGWSPDDVKSEEEHAKKIQTNDDLLNKIRVLEMERSNHLEEIKQLQIKSGKLIKKLKEFKQKNEQLNQTKKTDDFNLDDAIVDELKSQIESLEKKIKETVAELDKEKKDKENVLKRIDVLTAANERLIEMKEKQDVELLSWQRQSRELSSKLEKFEWGNDSFATSETKVKDETSEKPTHSDLDGLNKRVEELNKTVEELTLDNEELQNLLEEQRNLRMESEKLQKSSNEISSLVEENNVLKEQNEANLYEKKELQDQLNRSIKIRNEMEERLNGAKEDLDNLTIAKDQIIENLTVQISNLESEKLNQAFNQSQEEQLAYLQNQFKEIEVENARLANLIVERDNSILILQNNESLLNKNIEDLTNLESEALSTLNKQNLTLINDLQDKNSEIVLLKQLQEEQVDLLRTELSQQLKVVQKLAEENKNLTETIVQKEQLLEKLTSDLNNKDMEVELNLKQFTQEWELRVDQRGSDVAESWKLHLESRETEFGQLEQMLRKEIHELEEKCNGLVNENNELRKNVDAEIRNEVDRISALQQQINDRQIYINELTKNLTETQTVCESLRLEITNKNQELVEKCQLIDELRIQLDDIQQKLEDSNEIVDSLVKNYLVEHEVSRDDKTGILTALDLETTKTSDKDKEIERLRQQLDEFNVKLSSLHEDSCSKKELLEKTLAKYEENRVQMEQFKDNFSRQQLIIQENQQTIAHLTNQLQQDQNMKDYENENTHNLQQNLLECQGVISQLQETNTRLEARLAEIQNYQKIIREKDYEIVELQRQLQETQYEIQQKDTMIQEFNQTVDNLNKRLQDNQTHYEETLVLKESDLNSLQLQLEEQKSEITHLSSKCQLVEELTIQLNEKTKECVDLNTKITEQSVLIDEENKQLTELRNIIENQVLKIEELKNDLFQKSNEYDSMIAEVDITRTEEHKQPVKQEEEDLTEPVSRADLDLALYMLHQRDVRCEELTVELTQLLEERDTLQLRLSSALREKEEFGKHSEEQPGGSGSTSKITEETKPVSLATKYVIVF